MKFPLPLRISVPAILFIFGIALGTLSFLFEWSLAVQRIDDVVTRHISFLGNQASGFAEYLFAKGDLSGLRKQISHLGADPCIKLAVVCDENQTVLVSSRYEFQGRPLAETPSAAAAPLSREASEKMIARVQFLKGGHQLLAVFPFLLAPHDGELVSSRVGMLILQYDIANPKQQALIAVVLRSAAVGVALVILCVGMWTLFHKILTKRVAALLDATQRVAAGDLNASARLTGSDELAQLGAGFDQMTGSLKLRAGELQTANQRMREEITERKLVEEALRNSEKRFRSVWESSCDGLRLTDHNGIILAVNAALCQLAGMPLESLIGQPFTILSRRRDKDIELDEYRERFQKKSFPATVEMELSRADGQIIDVEITHASVELEHQQALLLAVFRDISRRRQEEKRRIELERNLLETQKLESLGVMAGGIAHDFNNLLTGILGNACLAAMKLPPDAPARDHIDRVEKASLQAADLCKQMLAYSGRGRYELRRQDLNTIVKELLSLLQFSISKKAELILDLSPGVPAIEVDASQIRQVIMNLVINASEALGEHPGSIRVATGQLEAGRDYLASTYLSPDLPEGSYVYLDVTDTGEGMTPEVQARIFDPFFTTKFTGRGLGLAAVLGIVRGHGGALKIETHPGRGATFRFLLPAIPGEPACIPAAPPRIRGQRGRGLVLIVDDEPAVRQVGAQTLLGCGFHVLEAGDGLAGVAMFREHADAITVVLLDLTMPRMGGVEALKEIERIRPSAQVVLMSGYSQQDAMRDVKTAGLFLQKPFLPSELIEKVFQAAGRSNSEFP